MISLFLKMVCSPLACFWFLVKKDCRKIYPDEWEKPTGGVAAGTESG